MSETNPISAEVTKLLDKIPGPIRSAAIFYAPAITRMAEQDFYAFVRSLQNKNNLDAMTKLRASMTVEELADEKTRLAELTVIMAIDSYESRQMAQAILRAAFTVALTAGGL